MKVSSKSAESVGAAHIPYHEASSLLQVASFNNSLLLKLLDRIGTAIALGEAGDLNAAHEFRKKNSGDLL